jgi:hypothetical protein
MRRATMVSLSAVMLLTLVAGPADAGSIGHQDGPPAFGAGRVIEVLARSRMVRRGGLTLTTYYRNDVIVGQKIAMTSSGGRGQLGSVGQRDQTIVYDLRRGSATTVRSDRRAVLHPGTSQDSRRSPGTAVAATSGRLDPKTLPIRTSVAAERRRRGRRTATCSSRA